MSSGDTARPAPDVEGLLRAWLQTQECKERGAHLLRADDFQGVCDGHLVEARLGKGDYREINPPAPPRARRSAAERSNRFVRGALLPSHLNTVPALGKGEGGSISAPKATAGTLEAERKERCPSGP